MKFNFKSLVVSLALLFVLLLMGLYKLFLPTLIEKENIKQLIQDSVASDYSLIINDLDTSLSWDFSLEAKIDELKLAHNSKNIFSSNSTTVKIPLISLLFQNINHTKICLKNLNAIITRDKDGKFNLQKAFNTSNILNKTPKIRLYAEQYDIRFKDNMLPAIHLKGENLAFENRKELKLNFDGEFTWQDGYKTSMRMYIAAKQPFSLYDICIDGDVKNLDIKRFAPYIMNFPSDVSAISGVINGQIYLDTLSRKMLLNNLDINLQTKNLLVSTKSFKNYFSLDKDSSIIAKGKFYKNKIHFDEMRIDSKNNKIRLAVQGSISDLKNQIKKMDLAAKIHNAPLKFLTGLIPKDIKIKSDAVNKLIKYNVDANINGEIKVIGEQNFPEFYGKLLLSELGVNEQNPLSSGVLSFNKTLIKMNFDLSDTKNGQFNLRGTSKVLQDQRVDFLASTQQFDIANLHTKLLAISDIFHFTVGPLREMQLSGNISAKLKIAGPTGVAGIWGNAVVSNARVSHNGFYKSVEVKNGILEFQDRKLLFNNLNSKLESYTTILNGSIGFNDNIDINIKVPNISLKLGKEFTDKSPILHKVSDKLKLIKDVSGDSNLTITLKGLTNNLKPNGQLILKNSKIQLSDYSFPITNLNGTLKFDDTTSEIQSAKGEALGAELYLSGEIQDQVAKLKIIANHTDLNQALNAARTSTALTNIASKLSDINYIQGATNAIINLEGNIKENPNIFKSLDADILSANVKFNDFLFPISILNGKVYADNDSILSKNILIRTIGTKGLLNGSVKTINNKPKYDLLVKFENLNSNTLKALQEMDFNPDMHSELIKFGNFSGKASGIIKINEHISGNINFNGLAGDYLPLGLPCKITTGELNIKNDRFDLSDITIKLGNSIFNTTGYFDASGNGAVLLDGKLIVDDVDSFINKVADRSLNLKQSVPIKINITQKGFNDTDLDFGLYLKKGNVISYKGGSIGSDDSAHLIGGKLHLKGPNIYIKNAGIQQYANDIDHKDAFHNIANTKNLIGVSGSINKKSNNQKLEVNINKFMDINMLNAFLPQDRIFEGGKFKGNLALEGAISSPTIFGAIEINNAHIPFLKAHINDSKLLFDKENIYIKGTSLKIANSDILVDAIIENTMEKPYIAKDLTITSNNINLDEILKIFQKEKVEPKGNLPLLVVKSGRINAEKLIMNNLISEDAKINFSFTPDWIMGIDDFTLKTAGGNVNGNSTIDFATRDIDTHLKIKNVKANAFCTILLQIPNEIYGVLDGEANFTTKGILQKDLIKNANGNAKFQIHSGRLVRLGSMEYLLTAAEVVKSGLTGLCINNVVSLVSPKNTGHFKTINASFKVKNGILYTDSLVSRGDKLSMYMAGSFDMTTNFSDLMILGHLSKAVTGILGPVGNFSINKVVHSIPGITNPNKNLSNILPGLSKIPGIDFNDDEYRRFLVKVEGNLYEPKSVRKFKWLD